MRKTPVDEFFGRSLFRHAGAARPAVILALLAGLLPHAAAHAAGPHPADPQHTDPAARILAAQLQMRLARQGSAPRPRDNAACWPLLSAVPSGPVPKGASWHEGDISSDNPYLTPQERWCLTAVTGHPDSLAATSTAASAPVAPAGSGADRYPGILPPGARAVRLKGGGWQICF